MQKPNNYDSISVGGFQPVVPGGHYMTVLRVVEQKNKNGGDMIVVAFDFDQKDAQPGYFKGLFDGDDKLNKKWPYQGTQYINVLTKTGDCTKSFKQFCYYIEKSNGFKIDWDSPDFCQQFRGRKIGGVFGKVEHEYNGKVTMRTELRWFCEYSKAADAKVPEDRMLNKAAASAAPAAPKPTDPFDDDVPF